MLGAEMENSHGSNSSSSQNDEQTDTEDVLTPNSATKEYWGIIPRAVADLFDLVHQSRSTDGSLSVVIKCSYLQIYNEKIYDLLKDPPSLSSTLFKNQLNPTTNALSLREEEDGNLHITGLNQIIVHNTEEVLILLRRGRANRCIRETEYNSQSSRSHAILQLSVTISSDVDSPVSNPEQDATDVCSRFSKLNLVDLAGSEKWNTNVEMAQRHEVELRNINSSLSALGNCMAALTEAGRKHIPYRDSILTRMLQDSLGGNTHTVILATVSMLSKSVDETIRTLLFADRAKSVMQRVKMNRAINGSVALASAKEEISHLLKRMAKLQQFSVAKTTSASTDQTSMQSIVDEKQAQICALTRENEEFRKKIQMGDDAIFHLKQTITELSQSCASRDAKLLPLPIPTLVIEAAPNGLVPQVPVDHSGITRTSSFYDHTHRDEDQLLEPQDVVMPEVESEVDTEAYHDDDPVDTEEYHDPLVETHRSERDTSSTGEEMPLDIERQRPVNEYSPSLNLLRASPAISKPSPDLPQGNHGLLLPRASPTKSLLPPSSSSSSEKCSRHQLAGCVLCALNNKNATTNPAGPASPVKSFPSSYSKLSTFASSSSSPVKLSMTKCPVHQLSGCILCTRVCPLKQQRQTSQRLDWNQRDPLPPRPQIPIIQDQNMGSPKQQPPDQCSRHRLANCILCSDGNVVNRPSFSKPLQQSKPRPHPPVLAVSSSRNDDPEDSHLSSKLSYPVSQSHDVHLPEISSSRPALLEAPRPLDERSVSHKSPDELKRRLVRSECSPSIKGKMKIRSPAKSHPSPKYVLDALTAATTAMSIRRR